ncbi:hypothetical protein PCANC_02507 [Puccinia coronata f. sp. avenae]|uniref:Uncharacterized protein n=1 Tax=Puccinia coronata f. sp. avenae TaxID=200324 RepID=A0A2N5VYH9_9BASI|nr:hypothetical protein PCANC_02507 [Puccinia coronata f. sp. avenae]
MYRPNFVHNWWLRNCRLGGSSGAVPYTRRGSRREELGYRTTTFSTDTETALVGLEKKTPKGRWMDPSGCHFTSNPAPPFPRIDSVMPPPAPTQPMSHARAE